MNRRPKVSILICTRDRYDDLKATLATIQETEIPKTIDIELVVVDNGSRDQTFAVISELGSSRIPPRYVIENQAGLDFARNTGINACEGDVILLTDDDTRVPVRWVADMCTPIFAGLADAVAGGIAMAAHLERPWMRGDLLVWRRVVCDPEPGVVPALIGANCAIARRVFERVQKFDEELDAGRLGLAGDILFSNQLQQAGFRIVSAISKTAVVHHFDPSRLSRLSLIKRSHDQGRSDAYIAYHWSHNEPSWIRLRLAYRLARLWIHRIRFILKRPPIEGITPAESAAICRVEFYRGLLAERQRPRQYSLRGLEKSGALDRPGKRATWCC